MLNLKNHERREDLTGEHSFGDNGQAILFLLFMTVWITDAFVFRYSTLLDQYIPFYAVRLPLGIIILVLAVYLAWTGMRIIFGEAREKPVVIRKGIYGVVRHPIYLSEILFYFSLIVFKISLAALAVWVIAVWFLHYISRYEEKLLLERFGDDYRQYMKDVPMYFPRIVRRKEKM
jgi:protein-S-isoprenylcysteine O-methyltransferase Ste14